MLLQAAAVSLASEKLYVANSAGNDIHVVDTSTNKVIKRIEVGPEPHGLVATGTGDRIFITIENVKGESGELLWFDPLTDTVTRRMKIGPRPNQLACTPDGKLAYIPCDDASWWVVDTVLGKVVTKIATGGRPHNTLASPDGKRMYLGPKGSYHVLIADAMTHQLIGEIPLSDAPRPIAISRDEKRFYANVDTLIGFEVADIPSRKVIHRVEAEVPAELLRKSSRSHGIGLTPDEKELWMCDVYHDRTYVFDLAVEPPRQVATITMRGGGYWMCFSPDGKKCYISERVGNTVAVIDAATRDTVARIAVGQVPKRVLVVNVPSSPASKSNAADDDAHDADELADVKDIPVQDLRVGGDDKKRYFLIGKLEPPDSPADAAGLVVLLPGGDGSADFHPFVRRISKNVLPKGWLIAQAVAPQWDANQSAQLVWPTEKSPYAGAQFTTEEFIEAIIADVRAKAKIDARRIFLLGWSSGGPPCYAAALRKETPVTGAFIAMSIFKPQQVSAIENAKGRAFYLLQSKDDRVTPIRFAELAEETLGAAGASVRLERYDGGHGWRGNVWKMIGDGIQWLEKPVSASIKAADPALKDPAGTESPAGKPGANILLNPSFEDGDKSPADWESGAEIDGVEYVWDKNVGQKGKASLCLNKSAKRYFPIAQWSQIVKRETDRPLLQVSAQVKAERVTKATIDVIFLDENDEMISHEWAAYIGAKEAKDSPAQHDWKEYQGKVKIPAKTRKLQIGLQIYGPGKVWFDDIRAEYVK